MALISLHIISKEGHIHYPYLYDAPPTINSARKILPINSYQQFNDSINIISEYNYHKDILDKFLRLYHLIENFMYKSPLVTIEVKRKGAIFSIRDFQIMYEKMNDKELNALKKLMKKILDNFYIPGVKFKQFVFNKWTSLSTTISKDKLDELLGILGVTKQNGDDYLFDEVDITNIHNIYPHIIYAYRNSLVHNRETEFHLTHEALLNHESLASTIKDVLESFIIHTLEEISFYLIIEKNGIVWLENPSLKLWSNTK